MQGGRRIEPNPVSSRSRRRTNGARVVSLGNRCCARISIKACEAESAYGKTEWSWLPLLQSSIVEAAPSGTGGSCGPKGATFESRSTAGLGAESDGAGARDQRARSKLEKPIAR